MSEQVACCPACGDPLVLTFAVPKKEYHCVACRRWWEFLQPRGQAATPERIALFQKHSEQFRSECRHMNHVQPCGPTGDEMYCACGCSGADEYCGADLINALSLLVLGKEFTG